MPREICRLEISLEFGQTTDISTVEKNKAIKFVLLHLRLFEAKNQYKYFSRVIMGVLTHSVLLTRHRDRLHYLHSSVHRLKVLTVKVRTVLP